MKPLPSLGVETILELEELLIPMLDDRFGIDFNYRLLVNALDYLDRLYGGCAPGFLECDTPYHDLKHSLDTALAAARIADGLIAAGEPLGAEEMALLILAALYHDVGYIRRADEMDIQGGTLTKVHVGRSESFFFHWLSQSVLKKHAYEASLMLHYSGYEESVAALDVQLPDCYRRLGKIIATADLVSQLADRYYLERCRDALFMEFSLAGGMGMATADELLENTPAFIATVRRERLCRDLEGYYRYLEGHFGCTPDPYMEAIDRSADFIGKLAATRDFCSLRRNTALRTAYRLGIHRRDPDFLPEDFPAAAADRWAHPDAPRVQ